LQFQSNSGKKIHNGKSKGAVEKKIRPGVERGLANVICAKVKIAPAPPFEMTERER
jgi:hypothetical protein